MITPYSAIGMTDEQGRVYETLLRFGPLSIADIVRKCSLHRPKAYKILAPLIENGLVAEVPKGKYKVYFANSPQKIYTVFRDRKKLYDEHIEYLHELYTKQTFMSRITYGKGRQAIHDAYLDVVKTVPPKGKYYRYSSSKNLNREKRQEKYLPSEYRLLRDQKKLERLVITNEPTKKDHVHRLGRVIKTVPPAYDLFEYDINQFIYEDKVSIIDFNNDSVITIQNPLLAEFQKKIFTLLFKYL